MISRSNRFHGRNSIQRLYKAGKSVRSETLMLRYAPNPRRKSYRLAIVVSRKISKSAVVRNRIRRRLYENVRILSSSFVDPYDLIIVVYDEKVAAMPAEQLAKEVAKLIQKSKLAAVKAAPHGIVET
ncbi:MAG: ribonuclease P protein component [Candidatus Saccharibacteria bacterium]